MKYTCSICGQSGSAENLPETCPACGTESENLWALSEDLADQLLPGSDGRAKPPNSALLNRKVFWFLLVVICLIPLPLGHGEFNDLVSLSVIGDGLIKKSKTNQGDTNAAAKPSSSESSLDRLFVELGQPESAGGDGGGSGSGGGPAGNFDETGKPSMKQSAKPNTTRESLRSPDTIVTEDESKVRSPQQCLTSSNKIGGLIFAIDVSVSMGLPQDFPIAIEQGLDQRIDAGDEEARAAYRAHLRSAGPKRLDNAKTVLRDGLTRLPGGIRSGVVSFRSCGEIDTVGMADEADRGFLLDHIKSLKTRRGGETAITEGVAMAREMLGTNGGRIILITDGQETCGIDPCEAHKDLADNGIIADVIDLTGTSSLKCITQSTGGRYYQAPSRLDLAELDAFLDKSIENHCSGADQ